MRVKMLIEGGFFWWTALIQVVALLVNNLLAVLLTLPTIPLMGSRFKTA
jgi:hypothetical protein